VTPKRPTFLARFAWRRWLASPGRLRVGPLFMILLLVAIAPVGAVNA